MTRPLRCLGAISTLFAALLGTESASAQDAPLRIGVITFLSGPAAGPFGVPAKNAAEMLVDVLNKGGQIPGYEKKGFGGRALEVVYVDEAGGPTKVVTEYRNLVARQNVDMVIGVISSGVCLAVAPVAEELKKVDGKLTLINIKYYPPSQISPPDGMKSVDWIRSGFKH